MHNKRWCSCERKSAPFCHYLIFDSVVGAYVTADARSQHVAQQPGTFLHPIAGISPPPPQHCCTRPQERASPQGLKRPLSAEGCTCGSRPDEDGFFHASNGETFLDLQEIQTSAGKRPARPSAARQRKQTNTKVRTFPTGQTTQRCSNHPPKNR